MIRGLPRSPWVSLSALLVFAFYGLNIDVLLGLQRYSPYFFQAAALAALLTVYAWQPSRNGHQSLLRLSSHPVVAWVVILLCLSTLSFLTISDSVYAVQGILYAASTTAILVAGAVAFGCLPPPPRVATAYCAVLALVVASVSVLVDPLVDIRSYFPSIVGSEYELSRAGGLFLQPNIAGAAITVLLAVVIPRVRPMVGLAASLLALASVVLTFSRSGILLLVLLVGLALLRGFLPRGWGLVVLVTCAYSFVAFEGVTLVSEVFHIDQGSGLARLTRTAQFVDNEALSNDLRVEVARAAWDDVTKAPFVGGGVGYSWYWGDSRNDRQGPHNMYLRYMLEFGLAGALLWPLLLLALYAARNRALDSAWVIGVLAAAFIAAFFSHNLTEQGVFLIPLMGAVCLPAPARQKASQTRSRSK